MKRKSAIIIIITAMITRTGMLTVLITITPKGASNSACSLCLLPLSV